MRVEIADHVRTTADAEGAVLLDLERGIYLSLNRSAAAIWEQLRQGRAPAQIAGALAARYRKPEAELGADVAAFVASLETRGLVRVSR